MEIKTKKVDLSVSDGTTMAAYVAEPGGGDKHPGIIVFQEAFGVNAYIRSITERFAHEGYIAIAPELFHRTAPGFEGSYDDYESIKPHLEALSDTNLEIDASAVYEWLKNNSQVTEDKIFSVGFCMGGRVSYLANSKLSIKAAISFYGGNIAPSLLSCASELHGPMLFFWGGLDQRILPEHRHAVETALDNAKKIYVNVEFSDANHGFFCDARASYSKKASTQAWPMVLQFLKAQSD